VEISKGFTLWGLSSLITSMKVSSVMCSIPGCRTVGGRRTDFVHVMPVRAPNM